MAITGHIQYSTPYEVSYSPFPPREGSGHRGNYTRRRSFYGRGQKFKSLPGYATVHLSVRSGNSGRKVFGKFCIRPRPIQMTVHLLVPKRGTNKRRLGQIVQFLAQLCNCWRETQGSARSVDTPHTQEMDMVLLLNYRPSQS